MDKQTLELIVAVMHRGSFAAVARERLLDPSSVSRSIADLERELGFRIFHRTTRRLALTESGAAFLTRLEPLLEELERAQDEALNLQGEPRGTLRLTASVTFGQKCIVPLLAAFRQSYPSLRLECLFSDATLDLLSERIDLAVRLAPTVSGDFVVTKLMDTHYRVVASPSYVAASPPLKAPSDLERRRCLLFPLRAFRSRWLFCDAQGQERSVAVDGDVVLSPASALRDAALQGLGPALLPDWLIDEDLEAGRLIRLLPAYRVTATTFNTAAWLLYPSRAFLPLKVRVMIDFLKARLRGA